MRARFLCLAGLAAVFLSIEAQGALIPGVGQNPSSPYYADFTTKNLGVHYSFANGVGTINVSNLLGTAKSGEGYTSQSSTAGTHGQGHPGTASPFTGFYTLNATIVQNPADGNQWEVTGGNFAIQGDLFHVGDSSHQTDLLLTGTLRTGNGSFGFDSTQKELEFLFTTGSSGDSSILADFLGTGIGNGAILLNWGVTVGTFNLLGNWSNTGTGQADTFVPEPVYYPFAAAGIAMFGLVAVRRKSLPQ